MLFTYQPALYLSLSRSRLPLDDYNYVSANVKHINEIGEYIPFVYTHILRNKRLDVEDDFASSLAPVFVEGGPLDDFRFELVVRLRYELPRQRLNDSSRIDAMGEEVVKLGADLEEACWAAFLYNLVCDLRDESFPVGGWDVCQLCDVLTAIMIRLQ